MQKYLSEAEVITTLCLDKNKDGTRRKYPHKALYKLIVIGSRAPGRGRYIKLQASLIAGKYVVSEVALRGFIEAMQV